jgi:hypothetical protein
MEDDLAFYADWRHVKDRNLTSHQLKEALHTMQHERKTAGKDMQAHIDWWRPIYEGHLHSTRSKELYESKMSWWYAR